MGRRRDRQRSARPKARATGRACQKLEHELAATKEYLQSLIEEHGRTNDELSSANEELVSGNEELQSMNEELETAKEELQSTNEELTTVNDELHSRNQEVNQINSDLVNLLGTVDIPIVILDIERRIRRFTPKARSILNVLPSDVGRPLDDIKTNVDVPDLDEQIAEVIETNAMRESEVQDRDGRWYRMQIRPYKTTDNKIDGAILSLVDIDALKHHVGEAEQAQGGGRARQSRQGRVPGDALSRAAHAALQHVDAGAAAAQSRTDPKAQARRRGHRARRRECRCSSSTISSTCRASSPASCKMELEAVDLAAVIRAALEGVSAPAEKKSIELEIVARSDPSAESPAIRRGCSRSCRTCSPTRSSSRPRADR